MSSSRDDGVDMSNEKASETASEWDFYDRAAIAAAAALMQRNTRTLAVGSGTQTLPSSGLDEIARLAYDYADALAREAKGRRKRDEGPNAMRFFKSPVVWLQHVCHPRDGQADPKTEPALKMLWAHLCDGWNPSTFTEAINDVKELQPRKIASLGHLSNQGKIEPIRERALELLQQQVL